MRLPALLLCLLATGCGKKIYQVDPQLQPYVDRFIAESNKVGQPIVVDNLIASIGTLSNPKWAGQCDFNDTPTITIDAVDWALFDDVMREQVMFHELGHCVLLRNHNNDVDGFNIPVSIMYWQMSYENLYTQRRGDWLLELFYYDGPSQSGSTPGTIIN